jgi:hypothetical protein
VAEPECLRMACDACTPPPFNRAKDEDALRALVGVRVGWLVTNGRCPDRPKDT